MMPSEDFVLEGLFRHCQTVEEVIFQLAGAASVCWEHIELAGIFNSRQAEKFGWEAVARLRELNIAAH